jgi:hypothetical protein
MYEVRVPGKIIRLVRATKKDEEAQVKVQTQLTEPFKTRQGVKQVDGLAPRLFNFAPECVIRKLSVNIKGNIEHDTAQVTGYADVICPLKRNARTINEVYQDLKKVVLETGLHINIS